MDYIPSNISTAQRKLPLRALGTTRHQTPGPQREALQFSCSRFDEHHESDGANEHAQHVGDIVPIPINLTDTAAIDAAVLFWLEGTGEGGGDEGIFQFIGWWGCGWGDAGGLGEKVDKFEDKVARECSTQVGDTSNGLDGRWRGRGREMEGILTLLGASCMSHQWLGPQYVRGTPRWPRT